MRYTIETLISCRCYSIKVLHAFLFILLFSNCDDFVEVDLPQNQLTSSDVFQDAATATAAIRNIYVEMRDGGLMSGYEGGNSSELGLYADEMDQFNIQNPFFDHSISATNSRISGWWNHTYNLIYTANAIIEGVENSATLSLEDHNQLKGEALFIRGYLHFLLVELYGPVPYIRTTDYTVNVIAFRDPINKVYDYIIKDLIEAANLLSEDISGERIRVYKGVVKALLARVYLYTHQWHLAETMASNIINSFVLEPDLNKVFLKNASSTIWQFRPSVEGENASYGGSFIFTVNPGIKPTLSESMVKTFQPNDLRKYSWTRSVNSGSNTWYHAYKYKEAGSTENLDGEAESKEYPVVFRLAEQYLIRAEARAQRGDISGAQEDLNVVRTRAGLPNTIAASTDALLGVILQERRVELFTEHGHRWFDLKRLGKAAEILAPVKSNWQDKDILLPIPESEILLNPNLIPQNDGY
ncbi:RagB/SusD family nutrient uptake outer membrane protein [Flavivirga eckloniae]|uniref:RagB/SusD family nutrient uptake outer membrane protein n=1 Tax=Flavivirga eckloniae TaxID=1803846 RepID=A0A2K9PWU3_9FLAO|nr:RagB/SusD family nutrient uptake outer membrane protein [Flavivirga eckloniae]AUP81545.1 RagB/SusD family nutrient uptake outer membrane protein [Flavivirga eckloniae]